MGQRAHNRRHAGRRIRKERRELQIVIEALPGISRQFAELSVAFFEGFGKVVKDVTDALSGFAGSIFGYDLGHDVIVVPENARRKDYALTSFDGRGLEVDPECAPFGCAPDAHVFRPSNLIDQPATGYSYAQQREMYEKWRETHPLQITQKPTEV